MSISNELKEYLESIEREKEELEFFKEFGFKKCEEGARSLIKYYSERAKDLIDEFATV